MDKIFRVYASHGPSNYAELDLPASGYEMLDLMDRLRLEPGRQPRVEILKRKEEFGYLDQCIRTEPDLYQLNALAKKLSEFTSTHDMAAFEGLVGMEAQKGENPIALTTLIDFACSTDCCHVAGEAAADVQLGKFLVENEFVEETNGLPESALALLDYEKIGREHREREGGVYTGFGYVEQHSEVRHVSETMDFQPEKPAYRERLPADIERPGWSVRLKLASEAVPDGVWVKLPDYSIDNGESSNEIQMALAELRVERLEECVLRESRCVLPCIGDLACQYGSLADLVYDGQNLGYVLDEHGQGSPDFLERYLAALEYEGCQRLSDALNIASGLDAYDIIPVDTFLDNAMQELSQRSWMPNEEGVKNCFDYGAYAAALAEQQGYRLTDDGRNYIRMRDSPALEQQPGGMTMQ